MSKEVYEKLPFGIDLARVNGEVDWYGISRNARRVCFAGIRAAVSWGYEDPNFKSNWSASKWVKIPRAAYHVLYPGEDVKKQMAFFLQVVGHDQGELPLVLDVELDHGQSPARIREAVWTAGQYLFEKTGKRAIIYSRTSWIDQFMTGTDTPPAWYGLYDWWLAHYGPLNSLRYAPPTLPKGVPAEKVIIHQYGNGPSIGMQSKRTDYNVWLQGFDHLQAYLGTAEVEPDETPVAEENQDKLQFAINELMGLRDEIDELLEVLVPSNNG